MNNYQQIINAIYSELELFENTGKVASYIPELSKINPDKFAVYLTTIEGEGSYIGDYEEKFSIQSIAKVLSLIVAYKAEGKNLWRRVGVEPSGTAFNSLVQLESDFGIPRNPLINAGAIVICDVLIDCYKNNYKEEFINFVRHVSGNKNIDYSKKIAESEKSVGYRNFALANYIKSFSNIKNDVHEVLDFYFHVCSVEMTCKELSETFIFLANHGKSIYSDEQILTVSQTKRINSIMQLCGFYDEAGEFSYRVGLPGKSGVGGGIVAVLPGKYSIAVWSPPLNAKGNSAKGMKFLELFTTETEASIF